MLTNVRIIKTMVFPLVIYRCKNWIIKKGWAPKNWWFWVVVLEKTLESPLDIKEIQPVHPKGNQSWIFIRRTDVEAGTPILWPPDAKNWLLGKDLDAAKDWRQEEKGTLITTDHQHLLSLSKLRELVMARKAWIAAVYGVTKSRPRLSDWTETELISDYFPPRDFLQDSV